MFLTISLILCYNQGLTLYFTWKWKFLFNSCAKTNILVSFLDNSLRIKSPIAQDRTKIESLLEYRGSQCRKMQCPLTFWRHGSSVLVLQRTIKTRTCKVFGLDWASKRVSRPSPRLEGKDSREKVNPMDDGGGSLSKRVDSFILASR